MAYPLVGEVPCRDLLGRSRAAQVFALPGHRVGIQPPPGEWMELTLAELHLLWVTALSACNVAPPIVLAVAESNGHTRGSAA